MAGTNEVSFDGTHVASQGRGWEVAVLLVRFTVRPATGKYNHRAFRCTHMIFSSTSAYADSRWPCPCAIASCRPLPLGVTAGQAES
ncbi:protein of unknown function [Paraburkholderia kururiensis]